MPATIQQHTNTGLFFSPSLDIEPNAWQVCLDTTETSSLSREDYNELHEIMHRKKNKCFTVYWSLCVQVKHSHSEDQVHRGQPHPQHGSGRKLFNSIINSPLIQLHFFLFHFRITISGSPWKSPDRFPMIIGRRSCRQDLLDGPRHSSNNGMGWINLVDTPHISPPKEPAIFMCRFLFSFFFPGGEGVGKRHRAVAKLGSIQKQQQHVPLVCAWHLVRTQ